MKLLWMVCFFQLFFHSSEVVGQKVKVGLEIFPPLITQDVKGYSVEVLREIERISDLQFEITLMNYARAKQELKNSRIDLIGHTPYQRETEKFYQYAQDLQWSIQLFVDIYAIRKNNLSQNNFKNLEHIATPRGNESVFSKMYNIPLNNFHTGNIYNLLKMLSKGRVDLFIFERASTMTIINKLEIKNIYYRNIDSLAAGFSVRKDRQGTQLKQKLDLLFKTVQQKPELQRLFNQLESYWKLPKSGVVSIEGK